MDIKNDTICSLSNFKQPSDILFKNYPYFDFDSTNKYIQKLIESKEPFMVSRFGARELNAILHSNTGNFKNLELFHKHTGFFPPDQNLFEQYIKLHINKIIPEIDLLGSWIQKESVLMPYFSKNLKITKLSSLLPFFSESPWTQSLQGKKVLIIHPFAETIQKQYNKNRKFLFKNSSILPEFELKIIKAVQSIAGNIPLKYENKTWFDALEDMRTEALSINADIIIIGCGAYGMTLAGLLKKEGKKTIHLGGATQLLFGVQGKRWDKRAMFKKLQNNYWVRPNINERPLNYTSVEGGCYW